MSVNGWTEIDVEKKRKTNLTGKQLILVAHTDVWWEKGDD